MVPGGTKFAVTTLTTLKKRIAVGGLKFVSYEKTYKQSDPTAN